MNPCWNDENPDIFCIGGGFLLIKSINESLLCAVKQSAQKIILQFIREDLEVFQLLSILILFSNLAYKPKLIHTHP